jgi:glyoxylase I family protein
VAASAIHHVGMSCEDPIAIERWYCKHFGFERKRVYAPGPGQVVMIGLGNTYLELFKSTEALPAPKVAGAGQDYSGWRHIAFLVDDLDAKLAELGDDAQVTLGPIDFSEFIVGERTAWVSDPEGNIIELNHGYVDQDDPPPIAD